MYTHKYITLVSIYPCYPSFHTSVFSGVEKRRGVRHVWEPTAGRLVRREWRRGARREGGKKSERSSSRMG